MVKALSFSRNYEHLNVVLSDFALTCSEFQAGKYKLQFRIKSSNIVKLNHTESRLKCQDSTLINGPQWTSESITLSDKQIWVASTLLWFMNNANYWKILHIYPLCEKLWILVLHVERKDLLKLLQCIRIMNQPKFVIHILNQNTEINYLPTQFKKFQWHLVCLLEDYQILKTFSSGSLCLDIGVI